jgi:hypothetical protein
LPSVNAVYGDLKGRGLEVRLIAFREEPALVRRTVRERGYSAPVLLDPSGDTTGRAWGVFGPPTVYLLDRAGRMVGRAVGPVDWSSPAARQLLGTLLEEGKR